MAEKQGGECHMMWQNIAMNYIVDWRTICFHPQYSCGENSSGSIKNSFILRRVMQ